MTQSDQLQMLNISVIPEREWPTICRQFSDLSYEQTLTYSKAAADRIGAITEYLAFHDDQGQLIAAICLRIKPLPGLGKGVAWAPAGPMMSCNDPVTPGRLRAVLVLLSQYADQTGHILRLRLPVIAQHSAAEVAKVANSLSYCETAKAQSYRTVLIDCTHEEEQLMNDLHGKWRNPLRNALKAGLKLEVFPFAQAHQRFEKLYEEVQSAKGFHPEIPPDFYYDLQGIDFEHEVLIAQLDGHDVAGMTIVTANQSSVYLFGATTAQGRKLNAGHYLMWKSILYCKSKGVAWFDLGGIDPDANPSVARFKHRTGGVDITAPGPFEYKPAKISTAIIGLAESLYVKLKFR